MSKGGTTSGSTEIPAWLESAAIENINKARDVSQIGYVPYYGPDVAAFSPMQQQSMQSTGNAASAFGLAPQGFNAMAGMPQAQTFAGGVQGYSSAPLYEQSLDKLFANAPAQYRAMNDMFIDPFTGARPRGGYGATPTQVSQMSSGGGNGGDGYSSTMEHHNAFLNRMREEGAADVYDSIYRPNRSGDLVRGDTFVGDDGLNYTVGYDVGQVDPALANAVQRNKINEVRSNSSAVGSILGNTLQGGFIGRGIEALTGTAPFNSNDAPVGSLSNADVAATVGMTPDQYNSYQRQKTDEAIRQAGIDANNFSGMGYDQPQIQGGLLANSPYQADGNEQALAQARMQEDIRAEQAAQQEADRRAARQAEDLAAPARREAARVEAARVEADRVRQAAKVQAAMQAEVDYNQQMQREAALLENLRLSAVTTPYIAPVVRSTVNSNGDGTGARQRAGGSKVGGVNRGTNAFSGM